MKKEEILEKLNSLELDKSKYIIISGASLVCQNLLDETSDIDLACSLDYYNSISWNTKEGYFGSEIKYFDSFEIGTNFYDEAKIVEIDGYRFADVEATYELKKLENKPRDKKLIQKLELLVCSQDNYYFERKLRKTGVTLIAGVDEVGRGPLFCPVVAACVILPEHFSLEGLTDSKKLSEKKRDFYYDEIMRQAISVGIGIISEKKIDEVNIYEATKLAMKEAIDKSGVKPEHVLIDAMPLSVDIPTTSIIKGDFKSITISAASVIAKVTRDRMLDELDKKYPMYDFKDNKGYPTKKHLAAIEEYGIIPEHRKSYGPVRDYLEKQLSLFQE